MHPRRIIVTGGSSGIGLAIARAFVAAGDTVFVIARRSAEAFAIAAPDLSDRVTYHAVDLAELEGGVTEVDTIARGGLDLLVNAAGVMTYENASATSTASLRRHLDVDLVAPIRLTAAVLPTMMSQGRGHVIQIASVAGSRPTPKLAVYGAAKAGLIHYTKAVAAEVAHSGVRLNVVCPGAVRTGLVSRAHFMMIERGIPLGALQSADEVASLVLWLAGDGGKSVTGAVFAIDGGMSL